MPHIDLGTFHLATTLVGMLAQGAIWYVATQSMWWLFYTDL